MALLTNCSVELERVHEGEQPADAPEPIAATGTEALLDESTPPPAFVLSLGGAS